LQPRSESLGIFEDVVRDGNGGFHTESITAGVGVANQMREPRRRQSAISIARGGSPASWIAHTAR
jgi:hypothetical protein